MNEETKKIVAELRAQPEYKPEFYCSGFVDTMFCKPGYSIATFIILALVGSFVVEYASSAQMLMGSGKFVEVTVLPVWATTSISLAWVLGLFYFGNKKIKSLEAEHVRDRDAWFNAKLTAAGIDPLTVAAEREPVVAPASE